MLLNIGNITINLLKVMYVTSVYGDPSRKRYAIYFDAGESIEVNESEFKREYLIKAWKRALQIDSVFRK